MVFVKIYLQKSTVTGFLKAARTQPDLDGIYHLMNPVVLKVAVLYVLLEL